MKITDRRIAVACAAMIALTACVAPPAAPTIPVAPGPNKTFDAFAADQAVCQQYAAAQTSPSVAAANNQAVGGALLSSAPPSVRPPARPGPELQSVRPQVQPSAVWRTPAARLTRRCRCSSNTMS